MPSFFFFSIMKKKAPKEKLMNCFTKTPKDGKTQCGDPEVQEVATFSAIISKNYTVSPLNFYSIRENYLKEKELFSIEKFSNDIKFTEIGYILFEEFKNNNTFIKLLS